MYPVDNMNLGSALTNNLYNLSQHGRHCFNKELHMCFARLKNREKKTHSIFFLSVAFETSVGKLKKKVLQMK